MERWTAVIIKHHGKAFEREVFDKYEVSSMSNIRNKITGKVSISKSEQFLFYGADRNKSFMLKKYRVCLASFYPNKIPKNINNYDVDHIDGNHENNYIENLQWITREEHARKTYIQTKGKRKRKNRISLEIDPEEVFKPIGEYEVSNKGKFKHKNGFLTSGSKLRGTKYKKALIKLPGDYKRKTYYIHVLVWRAFNGPIEKGKVVMHDDNNHTLTPDGYERNWLCDLKLGTQKENCLSYHSNRNDLKSVYCYENKKTYPYAAIAAKELGLHRGHISSVCKGKRRKAGGYTFKYA